MTVKYKSYSYAYLLMAVHRSVKDLATAKPYPFVECLNILLHSALAFEAFLNHLGREVFEFWDPLKRKLSVIEKLQVIAAHRCVHIDWGSRPYQSVKQVVDFRNAVAHAESTEVDVAVISGETRESKSHWQSFCNEETALRLSGDIEQLIDSLPLALGVLMPKVSTLAEPSLEGDCDRSDVA